MIKEYVENVVTRELVDDIFGMIISKHGGWKPDLMPLYIDTVFDRVTTSKYHPLDLRKAVIKKMKELDPILFKRI